MKSLAVVILAAGKSTRMKSGLSKVLHKIAGRPVVSYPVGLASRLKPEKIVLVVAKGQEPLFSTLLGDRGGIKYCEQTVALGTGHAVLESEKLLKNFSGKVLILPGDVPLIRYETVERFVERALHEDSVCSIISTELPDPFQYGRVLRDSEGNFLAIREEKDASAAEKAIREINTGIFLADCRWLFDKLRRVKTHNVQKEYYLTDVIGLAVAANEYVTAHCFHPFEQFAGINSRLDLSQASCIMNSYITRSWMDFGVTIVNPGQTYVDSDVKVGVDTYIAPFCFLKGKTRIGKGCVIEAGSVLEDATIGDNAHIKPYSIVERSEIGAGATIGPFARIRPDSIIGENAKIGNFVEVKKSVLKKGVKASHLSYIGDASIDADTNVGCGTITCNYDGEKKHKTTIGKGVFIGSDVQFVAPVKIGNGSVIGAGTTVTKDVPPGALALSRVSQVNVPNYRKKRKLKRG